MKKNDGGAAFPKSSLLQDGNQTNDNSFSYCDTGAQRGMTLRDYFAAKALQGIHANPDPQMLSRNEIDIARIAYQQADAMIAERDKDNGN